MAVRERERVWSAGRAGEVTGGDENPAYDKLDSQFLSKVNTQALNKSLRTLLTLSVCPSDWGW
jgi:hypothetical protein